MPVTLRYLAPAGSPFSALDLARWSKVAVSTPNASAQLEAVLRGRFGVRNVFLTSTGRAGLAVLLRAMRRLAPAARDEVVVPSYTCYSVPASIAKAGLRVRIADISPYTLDYAPDALAGTDFSRVLAVVATNLYGLPNDLPGLQRLTRQHGCFLIDDAAQAMGGAVEGRWSGTWGDAGLFSFDKGKNVSAIDGGAIVTSSDDLADSLRLEMAGLRAPTAGASSMHVLKAIAYFAMLRPWLYGIPARIPQLGLGRTEYTTEFPLELADPVLMALGRIMMERLDEFTARRRSNAAATLEALRAVPGITAVAPRAGAAPAYLRLPLLVNAARAQRGVIQALNAGGIGATGSYPASLADVTEVQSLLANPRPSAAGGRDVARRIVTLPTHPFVRTSDIHRMAEILSDSTVSTPPQRAYLA